MKETVEFIKDAFNAGIDRLKFPLLNSFIFSWLVFNWRAVFIALFSEQSTEERIATINFYHSDIATNLWNPLFLASAYVFGLPLIKKLINLILGDINRMNRDDKYQFRIDAYSKKNELAKEKYNYSLNKAGIDDVLALSQRIDNLNTEVHNLKRDLFKANGVIKDKNTENDALTKRKAELEKSFESVDQIFEGFVFGYQERFGKIHKLISADDENLSQELYHAFEEDSRAVKIQKMEYENLKRILGLPNELN